MADRENQEFIMLLEARKGYANEDCHIKSNVAAIP